MITGTSYKTNRLIVRRQMDDAITIYWGEFAAAFVRFDEELAADDRGSAEA